MAPTRPITSSKSTKKKPSYAPKHGVQKRKKSPKEDEHMGRGRKKTWSMPWLKRLIVLRMCGLHFSEIFELLSVLSKGATPDIERTAQYNMKKLLGENWKQLCAPNKATSQKRLTFLTEMENQRLKTSLASIQALNLPKRATLSAPVETTTSYPENQCAFDFASSRRSLRIFTEVERQRLEDTMNSIQACNPLEHVPTSASVDGTPSTTASPPADQIPYPDRLPVIYEEMQGVFDELIVEELTASVENTFIPPDSFGSIVPNLVSCETFLETYYANPITYPEPPADPKLSQGLHEESYDTSERAIASSNVFRRPVGVPETCYDEMENDQFYRFDVGPEAAFTIENSSAFVIDDTSNYNASTIIIDDTSESPLAQYKLQTDSDKQSILSNQSERLSEILRRYSYTSSHRSLIKRTLRMQYSISSLATSSLQSDRSGSMTHVSQTGHRTHILSSVEEVEKSTKNDGPKNVLEELQSHNRSLNSDLARTCCSITTDCVHRQIAAAISDPNNLTYLKNVLDTSISHQEGTAEETTLNETLRHINTPDLSGRNALFFAASLAPSLVVLLELLRNTENVNAVDNNNRTFLFHLDLRGIAYTSYRCSLDGGPIKVHSSFECLTLFLEARSFNFDQVDKDNKSFLSWLCLSPHFDVGWLCDLKRRDEGWKQRILHLGRLQDVFGLSFFDRLSRNDRATLTNTHRDDRRLTNFGTKSTFVHSPDYYEWANVLFNDAESGRTRVHQRLLDVHKSKHRDIDVLQTARSLHFQGADLDATSRDGATPLSVAIEHSLLKTVEFLQPVGSSVQPVLKKAAKDFNRSRRAKASASLTARSMKTIALLLGKER